MSDLLFYLVFMVCTSDGANCAWDISVERYPLKECQQYGDEYITDGTYARLANDHFPNAKQVTISKSCMTGKQMFTNGIGVQT